MNLKRLSDMVLAFTYVNIQLKLHIVIGKLSYIKMLFFFYKFNDRRCIVIKSDFFITVL